MQGTQRCRRRGWRELRGDETTALSQLRNDGRSCATGSAAAFRMMADEGVRCGLEGGVTIAGGQAREMRGRRSETACSLTGARWRLRDRHGQTGERLSRAPAVRLTTQLDVGTKRRRDRDVRPSHFVIMKPVSGFVEAVRCSGSK